MDSNNYMGNLFEYILEGRIQNKTSKDHFSSLANVVNTVQNDKNKQNGAIFFVPQDQIQMVLENFPNSDLLNRTIDFAQRCTKTGVPFVIVVTKMDLCEPNIKKDPNNFNNYGKVRIMLNKTSEIFKISLDRVFPLVTESYVVGDEGKHSLTKLVYRILESVLIHRSLAEEYDDCW